MFLFRASICVYKEWVNEYQAVEKHLEEIHYYQHEREQGKWSTVSLDNLKCHTDVSCLKFEERNHAGCFFFVPNTTAFMQPLDYIIFGMFKREIITKSLPNWSDTLKTSDSRAIRRRLFGALDKAEQKATKANVIQTAWKNTGLFPFDPELIIRRAKDAVGQFEVQKKTQSEEGRRYLLLLVVVLLRFTSIISINIYKIYLAQFVSFHLILLCFFSLSLFYFAHSLQC